MRRKIILLTIFLGLAMRVLAPADFTSADYYSMGICDLEWLDVRCVTSSGVTIPSPIYDYGDDIYVYVKYEDLGQCETSLTFDNTRVYDYYLHTKLLLRNKAGETSTWWSGDKTNVPFQLDLVGSSATQLVPLMYRVRPYDPILSFSVSKNPITIRETVSLNYDVRGAVSCTASTVSTGAGSWSDAKSATTGTHTYSVTPSTTGEKTYKLSCNNRMGGTFEKTVNLTVDLNTSPTLSLSSSPATGTTIMTNTPVDLTWVVSGATSCSATGDWEISGPTPYTEGEHTQAVTPATSGIKKYNLQCFNNTAGTLVQTGIETVTMHVTSAIPPSCSNPTCGSDCGVIKKNYCMSGSTVLPESDCAGGCEDVICGSCQWKEVAP